MQTRHSLLLDCLTLSFAAFSSLSFNKRQLITLASRMVIRGHKICSKFRIMLIFPKVKCWNLVLGTHVEQVFSPWNFGFKFYAQTEGLLGPLHLRSSNAARHHSCFRLQLSPRQGSHLSRGRSKGPTLACNKQKSKKEASKHLMLGLELLRMNLSSDPCKRQKSKGGTKTSLIGIHNCEKWA